MMKINLRMLPDVIIKVDHLLYCFCFTTALFTFAVADEDFLRLLSNVFINKTFAENPESLWKSPMPVGDGDDDVKRFPNGNGGRDGDGE
ncbi:hypothetical protein Tco_1477114 [Tanacetum coccineum]